MAGACELICCSNKLESKADTGGKEEVFQLMVDPLSSRKDSVRPNPFVK